MSFTVLDRCKRFWHTGFKIWHGILNKSRGWTLLLKLLDVTHCHLILSSCEPNWYVSWPPHSGHSLGWRHYVFSLSICLPNSWEHDSRGTSWGNFITSDKKGWLELVVAPYLKHRVPRPESLQDRWIAEISSLKCGRSISTSHLIWLVSAGQNLTGPIGICWGERGGGCGWGSVVMNALVFVLRLESAVCAQWQNICSAAIQLILREPCPFHMMSMGWLPDGHVKCISCRSETIRLHLFVLLHGLSRVWVGPMFLYVRVNIVCPLSETWIRTQ